MALELGDTHRGLLVQLERIKDMVWADGVNLVPVMEVEVYRQCRS